MSQISEEQLNQASVMMSVVSQVGCGTVLLVFLGLGAGWLLDEWLGTGRIFTVVFMVGSVPVSLYLVFRIWLRAVRQLQPGKKQDALEEEKSV